MKRSTSIRISDEAWRLWHALAAKLGLNLIGTLELAIRKLAEREGVK